MAGATVTQGRLEDARLLRGQGRFVADALRPDMARAVFLRADVACGTLTRLDLTAVRDAEGVIAVITAAELAAAGIGPIAGELLPRDDGGAAVKVPMPLLAAGQVRHLGEPIAMVVARTEAAALAALDLAVVDVSAADPDTRLAAHRCLGDAAATEAAMAQARHRISADVSLPRLAAAPLETRGCVALPGTDGTLTLQSSTQNPFALRKALAAMFGWPAADLRVIAPDVGGSFGLKSFLTREEALVAWFARHSGAPLAWVSTRSESLIADHQGRGLTGRITLGLDADLRFCALSAEFDVDIGAYPDRRGFGMAHNAAGITGLYDIPVASAVVRGWLSPKAATAPYRGNGRPEATLAIEQVIDVAARQLGVDPVTLRRRNMIAPGQMPLRTALGFQLDGGDFPHLLDRAIALADRAGAAERKGAAVARGLLHGFGLAACVESAGGPIEKPRPDHARVIVRPDGRITLGVGVISVGQGHETAMSRMAAERLGVAIDRIDYVNGDTASTLDGRGSGGSAGITVAGSALWQALGAVIDTGRAITARHFDCAGQDVTYDAGTFTVTGRNQSLTLAEIAAQAGTGDEWRTEAQFTPEAPVFPNAVHCCEIEIDPETGTVHITRYAAVEDVGRVHNPDLVAGQVHGGVAMGLAQVLGEAMHYDPQGQILSGSLMDYYLLRAPDLPFLQLETVEVPTARNPLGVKGVGEAGTVGATAALMSAITDALAARGISGFQMPATPGRIWQAIHDAGTTA